MPDRQNLPVEMRTTHKRCSGCQKTKVIAEFYTNAARDDGLSQLCRQCHMAYLLDMRQKQRQRAIECLGGKCARCGFSDIRALQIDHVDGDGAAERKLGNAWNSMCTKIFAGERERYQVLCANCNYIKRAEKREYRAKSTYQSHIPTTRIWKGHEHVNKGRKESPDHKAAISAGLKAAYASGLRKRGHSEETKQKIRETKLNRPGGAARGVRNAATKLSPEQVSAIRERYAAGGVKQRDLGREFGVSQGHIHRLVTAPRETAR